MESSSAGEGFENGGAGAMSSAAEQHAAQEKIAEALARQMEGQLAEVIDCLVGFCLRFIDVYCAIIYTEYSSM